MKKPKIFMSSSVEALEVAREFGRQLEGSATILHWSEGAFHLGKTVVESLIEVADQSDFAVFILTAGDVSRTLDSQWSPRPNVLFELGFIAGRIGLSRTFVIVDEPSKVVLPTDLAGILYITISTKGRSDIGAAVAPAAYTIRREISEIRTRPDLPVEYYSCFISYSWNDQNFAARLYDDLQKVGIRCWLDAKEMKIGDRISDQIDRAIQAHDKVLLVLSQNSATSPWVKLEIKNAMELERARKKTVLFPIRLDDFVLDVSGIKEIDQLKEKYIVDFSDWKEPRRYQQAFSRLVKDLAISASVESGRHG